jgi:hypothetical protein
MTNHQQGGPRRASARHTMQAGAGIAVAKTGYFISRLPGMKFLSL